MRYPLYRLTRGLITLFMKCFYRVEYIGINNIPKNGPFILAGNHKSNLDCLLLISSTKRTIRFMAKKELMDKAGWFFRQFGIIPVNRKTKNKEALEEAYKVINDDGIVGIFPEGTFNKSPYVVLPFKYGCVKMASVTNSLIVPFAIKNDYKLFKRSVKIIFGKAYHLEKKDDLKKENICLMNKVIDLLGVDESV